MKRSEIVEKEAVETDGRKEGYRGDSLRSLYRSDGQNEVGRVKRGLAAKGVTGLRDNCDFATNGFYRPVLKHGPRSLTYMRVCEWKNSYAE